MAAANCTRISFSSTNRHLLLKKNPSFQIPLRQTNTIKSHFHSFPSVSLKSNNPFSFPNDNKPNFSNPHTNLFNSIFLGLDHSPTKWNFSTRPTKFSSNENLSVGLLDNEPEVAVVLLGWLGAKEKHLRRYAELYNKKGFHAVTFVASVRDVLSFDLGRNVEKRVGNFSEELASWVSDNEGGRERLLVFHTFSNTGWLAYGAIIDNWRGRRDLIEKVRGCVVDSGGDPNIDPKVWAAGFTAALLKKSSSATYSSTEAGGALRNDMDRSSKMGETRPILLESALLFTFEKLFSFLLNLPDINRRLTKVISVLSDNQPPCPQLYLYSTGDKVIPFQAVESLIEDQRKLGKRVFTYNFGSSPHVDHYRSFPDVYANQLHTFLKECLVTVGKLLTT